jgi:hypothetical protein
MNFRIGAVIASVSVIAMVGGVVSPRPPGMALPAPTPVHLAAADAAPPGAIPLAFLRNRFQYCEIICPYVVQGVLEVPVAAAQAPVVFLDRSRRRVTSLRLSVRPPRRRPGGSAPR